MWWIRLWRALMGKKAPTAGERERVPDPASMAIPTTSPATTGDNRASPSVPLQASQAQVLKVSASHSARDELAMSFVDLLLESSAQHDLAPNEAEQFILQELERLLSNGVPDRVVPQMPEVATNLLRELSDPNVSQDIILGHLHRDPAITAEVLKLANSPLFRTGNARIENLERALLQLGMNTLKSIVSTVLMKPMLDIRPIYFRMFGQHLWQHSLDTAQACQHLARYFGQGDPFNAYLVGLTHDVGKLTIFRLLIESFQRVHPDVQPRGAVFSRIVSERSPPLTMQILKHWGMPVFVQQAVEELDDSRSAAEVSGYGFILRQANILAEFRWLLGDTQPNSDEGRALMEKFGVPLLLLKTAFPELGSLEEAL